MKLNEKFVEQLSEIISSKTDVDKNTIRNKLMNIQNTIEETILNIKIIGYLVVNSIPDNMITKEDFLSLANASYNISNATRSSIIHELLKLTVLSDDEDEQNEMDVTSRESVLGGILSTVVSLNNILDILQTLKKTFKIIDELKSSDEYLDEIFR